MRGLESLAILTSVGLLACACGGGTGSEAAVADPAPRLASVVTLEVVPRPVTARIELAADLLPLRRATLAAEIPGTVEQVRVDLGDAVREGEVLARIDTRTVAQQVAEAEAVHRQSADRAQRAEKLFERRSITRQALIDAQASLEIAAARLASARIALDKSGVRAPWAGRVASRSVEVGDYVAPGQPLLELVQVDRLKVRAAASAGDVPELRVGAPVTVTVDSLPGERFAGRIVRLGAELDAATRTLEVEAELPNLDGRLQPGLFGRLSVPLRELPDALLVPLAAVLDLEDGRALYVVEDGRAHRRRVELGRVLGDRVVVTSGLEGGERVVVRGQGRVAEGQPVEEERAGAGEAAP